MLLINSNIVLKYNKVFIGDIFALLCILFASLVPYNDQLNAYALYAALPVSFVWCFCRYNVILNNMAMKHIFLLYVWVGVCYFFAGNYMLADAEMKRILGSFILCYAIGALAKKEKLIPYLYGVYITLLFAAWYYAKNNILSVIDVGSERLNDNVLNANTLAYYTLYFTFVVYILGEILCGWKRYIFRVALFGVVALSFYTAIVTASRQVLLLQIPLLGILFWYRYLRESYKGILILLLSIIVCFFVFDNYAKSVYDNSLLKNRSEVSIKDDSRYKLIVECVEHGLDKPFFGYGPGNSVSVISTKHFAHNTFLELLVNTGVIGMVLFSFMILKFIKLQYMHWRTTRNSMFFIFLIFGLFWLLDQMLYVFYTDLWLMSFFVLIASHSEYYYRKLLLKDTGYIVERKSVVY